MLRIVGGKYKGRKLLTPKGLDTRPTLEKTREIIFDIISSRYSLENFEAVDLFAGSGAMGFEALSRGVKNVTFVEISKANCRLIHNNIKKLDAENTCQICPQDAIKWIQQHDWSKYANLCFLDPPYESELNQQAINILGNTRLQLDESLFVLETNKDHQIFYSDKFKLFRQKIAGRTKLDFLYTSGER